jgi:phage gp36-like protein
MPYTTAIEPVASAARTATGTGTAIDLGVHTTALLTLMVTAVSGTSPTLAVTIETAPTSTGPAWTSLGSFTTVSAVAVAEKRFPGAQRYLRARWTIAGTSPSFTFSVAGTSRLLYCTPTDIKRETPARALVTVNNTALTDAQLDEFGESASDEADDYLNGRGWKLPLAKWSSNLRRHVANMAGYMALEQRGFNPDDPNATSLVSRHQRAIQYLKSIPKMEIDLAHTTDATPDTDEGSAYITTPTLKGW